MHRGCERLRALLVDPGSAADLDAACWDVVVRAARRSGVLARLAVRLSRHGVEAPTEVQRHLDAELRIAEAHRGNVRWEVRRIAEALGSANIEFALLKGAAYALGDLPPAEGRIFEDVDILVRRDRLEAAESALGVHGWVTTHRHPYDQRYYRKWMHELPPLQHVRRNTSLDVHHTLLPLTAPLTPNAQRLWADLRSLPGWPGVKWPCPEDLVLHASAHLFFDGAFENGLRDLLDIDDLLRHFSTDPNFWNALVARARVMNLEVPLADALYWVRRLLATPVPDDAMSGLERASRWRRAVVRPLFAEGLRPDHPLCTRHWTRFAHWLLYVRSHFVRMPPYMVVPHLVRKALRPGPAE